MAGSSKNAEWGGKRKGAGRKRGLVFSERRQIASAYFTRRQKVRDLELQNHSPRREAVIRKLMTEHGVTLRMVERVIA